MAEWPAATTCPICDGQGTGCRTAPPGTLGAACTWPGLDAVADLEAVARAGGFELLGRDAPTGAVVFGVCPKPSGRRRVDVELIDHDEATTLDRVIRVLAMSPDGAGVYARGVELVRVRTASGRPVLVPLNRAAARDLVTGLIRFVHDDGGLSKTASNADVLAARAKKAEEKVEVARRRVAKAEKAGDDTTKAAGLLAEAEQAAAQAAERAKAAAGRRERELAGEVVTGTEVPCPAWLPDALIARGEYPDVPAIEGVVGHPIVCPDGRVLNTPGYDPETRLYLTAGADVDVPANLTRDDAAKALAELEEVVADFRWAGPVDRSVWVAYVLTLAGRRAFDGPAPLFAFSASAPGAGKTMLCTIGAAIVHGTKDVPLTSYKHDRDDEVRKVITTHVRAGTPLVVFDNVKDSFGTPALDAALTTTAWCDRMLGTNAVVEGSLAGTVWAANGNNIGVVGDTRRRVLLANVATDCERPENRTGFAHPNLMGWVLAERPRLLSAAIRVIAAYHQAGRPAVDRRPLGSFEGWSGLIAAAIVWAGGEDPVRSQETLRETEDVELDAIRWIVANWDAVAGPAQAGGRRAAEATVADILRKVQPTDSYGRIVPVNGRAGEALDALRAISPQLNNRTIGAALKRHKDRIHAGYRLVAVGRSHGMTRWASERVE